MRELVAGAMVVSIVLVASTSSDDDAGAAASRVPNPIVTAASRGVTVRRAGGLRYDVADFGYQEHEFLFGGRAETYSPLVLPPERYRSRMIVWTPTDPSRFNGTTVVEWAEVSHSGRFELTVEHQTTQAPMLDRARLRLRPGQRGASEASATRTPTGACRTTSLNGADPRRYGTLVYPGDAYSFAVFNQALQAIQLPTGVAPLGQLATRIRHRRRLPTVDRQVLSARHAGPRCTALSVRHLWSAQRLPRQRRGRRRPVADAFLIDAAAPLPSPPVPGAHPASPRRVRDRRSPTPDRRNHVTWEIIGASYVDRWSAGHVDLRRPSLQRRTRLRKARPPRAATTTSARTPSLGTICSPGPRDRDHVPRRFTLNAAAGRPGCGWLAHRRPGTGCPADRAGRPAARLAPRP